jgi:hypothetical protein
VPASAIYALLSAVRAKTFLDELQVEQFNLFAPSITSRKNGYEQLNYQYKLLLAAWFLKI